MPRDDIEEFVKERNEVLLSGDLDRVMQFQKKHNPGIDWEKMPESSRLAGMHKAITAVVALPRDYRMKSKRWLAQYGYKSLDDGDLSDV